jgi:hypothetical protein
MLHMAQNLLNYEQRILLAGPAAKPDLEPP